MISCFQTEPLFTLELWTSCEGSKLDPTICPSNPDLVAYVSANDIWVTHTIAGKDRRLTFAHKGQLVHYLFVHKCSIYMLTC